MAGGKKMFKCTKEHKQTNNKKESDNNLPTFVIGRRQAKQKETGTEGTP